MKLALRSLVFGALLSMCVAGPSAAQYMKILSDNPTDPTRMRASGTTILTITLDTNHDKDGSLQTCNSHTAARCGAPATPQPLDMFSYTLALRAVGGTVAWGTFTASDSAYTDDIPQKSNSTEIEINQSLRPVGTLTPAGLVTLGTLPVTALSGTPAILVQIGSGTLNSFGFGTGFGTECDGWDFTNTYVVGDPATPCGGGVAKAGDWFDADGVNAASGNPGTLSAIANMSVIAGSTADQSFSATDPDGDAITFSSTGPTFLTLVANNQVGTTRTGTVHLAPPAGTGGTFAASVTAASGGSLNTRNFTVLVSGSSAPILAQPSDMTVYVGETADQEVTATDGDGDPLTFSLVAGPFFATVTTTNPGSGTATGNIHLESVGSFGGLTSATVGVSDGISGDTKTLRITVESRVPVLTQPAGMFVNVGDTADQPLTARDDEGQPLTFTLVGGTPTFATVTTVDPGHGTATGNLHLAPGPSDPGTYPVKVSVSDGTFSDSKTLGVVVGAPAPPTIDPIPTLTVAEGDTLDFKVTASDPGGGMISFSFSGPSFMTLTPAPGCSEQHANLHLAPPIGSAGTYSASITASVGSRTATQSFTIEVAAAQAQSPTYEATVYLTGDNRVIRLASHTTWCAELEPAQSSFQVTDVISSSLTAAFGDARIHAVETRTMKGGGKDGAPRLAGFFGKDELREVFAALPNGKQTVDVLISGDLISGGSFKATVSVPVDKGTGAFGRASPNPFNPITAIGFELNKPGRVRLRVYDVSGRLVNTLADQGMGMGLHEVRWDGTNRNGSRVSSGVYFYVLETPERTVKWDLVVAK